MRGIIDDLALRRVGYGIEAQYCEIGGAALLAMLAERLVPAFLTETANASAAIQHTISAHARIPADTQDDEAAPPLGRVAI